ncbi:MAG: arylsulfatase A-like enzyme [Bacteroidia bacterium]|jgi:arylsulfatase A-like enzyme
MKERKSIFSTICRVVLLSLFMGCTAKQPPNFVFILVDDLGWKDLGCYGSEFYETPNIDRLASKSMLFTDAFASCPVCSPTRASIMTGKYPSRLNITDWIPGSNPKIKKLLGPEDLNEMPLAEVTIAETLKSNGYKTFFAGRWHLGDEGFFPEDQGFDINIGGHHKGSPPGGYYSPYKNPRLTDGPDGEYLTDLLTNESINFL